MNERQYNPGDSDQLTVSVVIPAYNIAQYVGRAIESVLAQSRPADEIIVVDDGSTDATADAIKRYLPQVKYIYQENRGLAGARNTGIREASGEWVAFLDGDDEWLPHALEKLMEIAKRNPELNWIGGNCLTCLCGENRRAPVVPPEKAREALAGKDYFQDCFAAFARGYRGNGDTMAVKREMFHSIGFFREHLRSAQDIDMWIRLGIALPKFGYACDPIAVYHLGRSTSISNAMNIRKRIDFVVWLMRDNITEAQQKNQFERFRPFARHHMTRAIRGWLFYRELSGDIRRVVAELPEAFNRSDVAIVRTLTVWPTATEMILRGISAVVRKLRLRRKVVSRSVRTWKDDAGRSKAQPDKPSTR